MKKTLLYEVPQEIFEPKVNLFGEQLLRIQYERDHDRKVRAGIFFHAVAATKIRDTGLCGDLVENKTLPNALYEIEHSPWKQAVLAEYPDAAYRERKHHYLFWAYDWAYEFLSDAWQLLPERDGWETDEWFGDWHRLRWSR
ncbi:MAG TPA: hypothetical protein VFB13_21710 [Reyranella sp.]|nr:hypothetical protein [Reyranella sp.]